MEDERIEQVGVSQGRVHDWRGGNGRASSNGGGGGGRAGARPTRRKAYRFRAGFGEFGDLVPFRDAAEREA